MSERGIDERWNCERVLGTLTSIAGIIVWFAGVAEWDQAVLLFLMGAAFDIRGRITLLGEDVARG